MSAPWQIIIASSDPDRLRSLTEILKHQDLEPICTSTVMECRKLLIKETIGLVFCDRNLADGNYSDLIAAGRSVNSIARFVVMSPQADWDEFSDAMRFGAFDVITAPCRPKDVEWMIIQAKRDDRKLARQSLPSSAGSLVRTAGRSS
jgi:DNA-binding NtrC family response regulator